MESDLAPIVEVLEEISLNTSDDDPSLPSAGKASRNSSRRASLFRRFLALICCSATTKSMSRRCSIQIVSSGSASPPSDRSSPTAQVGLVRVISLTDELHLSLSGETISEQDRRSIQSLTSEGSDPIQSYVLADKSSFDETVSEQDKSSLHYPDSEGSDFIQSEDSTPQRFVLTNESNIGETNLEQDRRSIQSYASEGSDPMQSEDLTSQGYVTSDELSLGETVSEHISGPVSEESDTTENDDLTSQGYVTADELSLGETVSEQDRRNTPSPSTQYEDSTSHGYVTSDELNLGETNIPYPIFEGYDSIQYEDSASEIYVTADELTEDNFTRRRISIESTFPPQNSAPGTIRIAGRLNNVSINI